MGWKLRFELREEHRLRTFQHRVLTMLGLKRREVAGGWIGAS